MFEVLFIMALTVIATVSMVIGIGELIDSKESSGMSSDMADQTGVPVSEEKPVSTISEIDLVYNDRMSRIDGSKIKGIRKEGNNLILEMAEEDMSGSSAVEQTMVDAIKNEEKTDMPDSTMEEKPMMDMPAMEPHVEDSTESEAPAKDDGEKKQEASMMDKIKKMTGI